MSEDSARKKNDVINLINKVKWEEGRLYLLISPSHHLIDTAFRDVKSYAKNKGLSTERYRLSKDEVESYSPKITSKTGRYYVCIASDSALAKITIKAERLRRIAMTQYVEKETQNEHAVEASQQEGVEAGAHSNAPLMESHSQNRAILPPPTTHF